MKAYNAKITKENIFNYFTQSGLTQEAFANILGVSKRWLEYVFSETKNYEFAPGTIQKACDFFIVDFGKFTTILLDAPMNLRETLTKRHVKNTEYNKILSDPPSVPFIIDKILIKDEEFAESQGMELKDVRRIILGYYPGLKLTNLSSDLKNSKFIHCWKHPTKKRTNLYRVK